MSCTEAGRTLHSNGGGVASSTALVPRQLELPPQPYQGGLVLGTLNVFSLAGNMGRGRDRA